MIDCRNVLDALREYYACEGSDDELLPLCEAAARELSLKVKKNADFGDIRLINAAASMANYRLNFKKLSSQDGVTSFKAGDVTVSISPEALTEQAEKEKTRAFLEALPLLKDDEFFFGQVCV
ncbi:MAG: hypothetical protein J6A60_01075 [Clostridia bacterium]|nr:hypothetical protein [Clostridia bacterium]